MNRSARAAAFAISALTAPVSLAQQDLTEATEVEVRLGTPEGVNTFVPDRLLLADDDFWQLILHNVADKDHTFSAPDFFQDVEVVETRLQDAEVAGELADIRLAAGESGSIFFRTSKPGRYRFHCTMPGHAEWGMAGVIEVQLTPTD